MAWLKNAARNVTAGMIAFVLFFGTLESLAHVVYGVRNSFVSYVPYGVLWRVACADQFGRGSAFKCRHRSCWRCFRLAAGHPGVTVGPRGSPAGGIVGAGVTIILSPSQFATARVAQV